MGVVNRSVITMADNKNDRLQSTHFLLSGEVKNSAELEHADFLLTDHPKAGIALDLLLATQGWRRFAEQEAAPANPADKPDVQQMLAAHGQRSSAPLELFKLEAQRLHAEFTPRLEQARLRTAKEVEEWKAITSPVDAKLRTARGAISVAESRENEAEEALNRFEEGFKNFAAAIQPTVLVAVMLIILFGLFVAGIKATADKPAGRGRPYIAVAGTVIVVGLVYLAITNLGHNANSTFSLVGSAIKPPGGGVASEAPQLKDLTNEDPGLMPDPKAPPRSQASSRRKADRHLRSHGTTQLACPRLGSVGVRPTSYQHPAAVGD